MKKHQITALYANGQELADVQNTTFSSGMVGLFEGTRTKEGLEVLFDNFIVYEPYH